jgi:hypothetical protein
MHKRDQTIGSIGSVQLFREKSREKEILETSIMGSVEPGLYQVKCLKLRKREGMIGTPSRVSQLSQTHAPRDYSEVKLNFNTSQCSLTNSVVPSIPLPLRNNPVAESRFISFQCHQDRDSKLYVVISQLWSES